MRSFFYLSRLGALVAAAASTLACGGAAHDTPTSATTAADTSGSSASPAPLALPAPVPLDQMSSSVRAAWAIADRLNASSRGVLLEAATADDCGPPLSRWHGEAAAALAEVDRLLESELALTAPAERAPASAVRGLAYLIAEETLSDITGFSGCYGAVDTAGPTLAELPERTGSDEVDRGQAVARVVDAWVARVTHDLNDCAYPAEVAPAWRDACRTWLTDGNPLRREGEAESADIQRTLRARARESATGSCVRARVMSFSASDYEFSSEPPRDEARAQASASAEANAALAYLESGHSWSALASRVHESALVAPAPDAVEEEMLDDVGNPLPRGSDAQEIELPISGSTWPEPIVRALLELPGGGDAIVGTVVDANGGLWVIERLARFDPDGACGG